MYVITKQWFIIFFPWLGVASFYVEAKLDQQVFAIIIRYNIL